MTNKLGTVAEHIKEVEKLYEAFKPLLNGFEIYDSGNYDKEYIELVNDATIMLTKDIDTTPYRNAKGDLITPIKQYCFLSSGINRNGLDSTGRIGRDYTISYYTQANVKPYRCQRSDKREVNKFYNYSETIQDLMDCFKYNVK